MSNPFAPGDEAFYSFFMAKKVITRYYSVVEVIGSSVKYIENGLTFTAHHEIFSSNKEESFKKLLLESSSVKEKAMVLAHWIKESYEKS